jgi:hypothetical protein
LLLNYALPRIRYIPVPQVPHDPFIALRPFFIVTSCPLPISLLALHFTQYPSMLSHRAEHHIKQTAVEDSI